MGYVEEVANAALDNDVDMEDEMPPLALDLSEDEVGPAGPYNIDADSDADSGEDVGGDEPPIKRARELHTFGVLLAPARMPTGAALRTAQAAETCSGVAGAITSLLDETVETPGATVKTRAGVVHGNRRGQAHIGGA